MRHESPSVNLDLKILSIKSLYSPSITMVHIIYFIILFLYIIFSIAIINSIHLIFKKLMLISDNASLFFFFNSLHNGDYSNLLIVAAFSNSPFSGKTYSLVKNSYFPTFPDDKAKILAVCLSKSYGVLFCLTCC